MQVVLVMDEKAVKKLHEQLKGGEQTEEARSVRLEVRRALAIARMRRRAKGETDARDQ